MSSLAELPELAGFFSYSREDDEAFKGTLSALRDGIQRELSAQLGRSKRTFRLWQDLEAIAPGKLWESEIKTAIDESFFFIPIVTPRSVGSKYCKFEFESFLAREKEIGRSDLVFPILYISVSALENEAKWRDDPVLSTIGRRQYVDWRPLRHLDVHTTAVREQIERICQKIVEVLNAPWISPEERRKMDEVKAQQQAEEKARRLKAEAKLRAEEEQRRKQAEAEARWRAAEERKRQKAEAKRLADDEEDRKRAEAEARAVADGRQEAEAKLRTEQGQAFTAAIEPHKAWPISPAFLKDWLENKQSARVTAGVAVLAVLLLIGVGGYAFLRHSVEGAVQRAELKWEEEHKTVEGRKQTEAETRTRYSALLSQGTTDAKINANDKAIATFSEAIRLDPGAAAAFYERGKAYRNKSNYDRAIADYNEAIRLDPKNASALSERCGAAYYISDFDKAIADCNEAIRLDPKNADTFVNRGLVFARIRDHERAMTDYNEALSLDPKYARAFMDRGLALIRKGDRERAIADFNETIRTR